MCGEANFVAFELLLPNKDTNTSVNVCVCSVACVACMRIPVCLYTNALLHVKQNKNEGRMERKMNDAKKHAHTHGISTLCLNDEK